MYDKRARAVFIFAAVTCILLRVWMKLTMIDPLTGFYKAGGSVFVMIFNGILLVAAAALFLLSLLGKQNIGADSGIRWGSGFVRATSFLCAAGAWAAAGQGVLMLYDSYLSTFNFGAAGNVIIGWILTFLAKLVFFVVAPLLSGWMWISAAARADLSKRPLQPFLCLAPVVWQCALGITFFMQFTAMRSVSDQQLSIAVAVLSVPFLLAYARLAGAVEPVRGMRQLRLFGYLFALLALVVSAGMIAAAPAGLTVLVGPPAALSLLFYPALGLQATALLFSIRKVQKP